MATGKKPTKDKLADYAEAVRKELDFRGQDEVFGIAVRVAHLAASADGKIDDGERKAIIDAVDVLSKGVVIELEVDALLDEASQSDEAPAARAESLGKKLAELGQPDAGLLFGAFVAQATAGIDKDERKLLREVGKAAGISASKIRRILKVVGGEAPEEA
jgi:tellurite resistance protein